MLYENNKSSEINNSILLQVVLSAIVVAAHGAPQVIYGGLGYPYGLGAYPYGYGLAAPAVVAAAPAEEEEPAEVAAAPALAYAGLPYAGLPFAGYPYAGLPYTVASLPKLEAPAAPAISYTLGGVPFIVPAVAAPEAEEVAEE